MNGPTDFTILLAGKKVKCVCLRSGKTRHIHLRIGDENSLSVTLPQNARLRDAETAVHRHARWILSQLRRRELEN
ncbi:MAG: M48 family metallopeptidase, partial [Acidobacteria bacterium]|nr:M48 family metallopeptidase [Acidobacteriota bacterium]